MTPVAAPSVTAVLAEFAAGPLPAIAESVHAVARRTVVNSVVLGACAGHHEPVRLARELARSVGSPRVAGVLGTSKRSGLLWAPLINGIAMHVEDFDDTHLSTVIHPGAPVVAAALAAAQHAGASGRAFYEAVLVGVEVALRVGIGMCPSHFDAGWHITGTAGHVGAAAAAGRLLGLDAGHLAVALALASAEAAGLTEANGSMTKSLHPGKAAADGVEAALLASLGITGPPDPIESSRGLAPLTSEDYRFESMLDGLGERWHTRDNTFKPYACGIVSHAVIDAGIRLRGTRSVPPEQIDDVLVRVNPVVLDVMGIADPSTGLESKFSVYHCFAVGFLRGMAGPAQFSDAEARAQDIVALRARVRVATDGAMPKDEADVAVTLSDGRQVHERVLHATGSLDRPMTDDQLRDKCRSLAEGSLGAAVETLVERAFGVADLNSVEPLFEAAVSSP